MFFCITLYQLLIDILADHTNSLLLQVGRLSHNCRFLLLNNRTRLLRHRSPPHLIKRVHIKRQIIALSIIICDRGVHKMIKRCKLVDVIPYPLIRGMKNMGAIYMDADSLLVAAINIPTSVRTFFHKQASFAPFTGFICKHTAKRTCAHDQIIIWPSHHTTPLILSQ